MYLNIVEFSKTLHDLNNILKSIAYSSGIVSEDRYETLNRLKTDLMNNYSTSLGLTSWHRTILRVRITDMYTNDSFDEIKTYMEKSKKEYDKWLEQNYGGHNG